MGFASRARYYVRRTKEAGVAASLDKAYSKAIPYLWAPAYISGFARARFPVQAVEHLEKLGFDLRASLRERRTIDTDYRTRAGERAVMALSGRWNVLGYGEANIPSRDAWSSDVFHNYHWPRQYFALVDFVATGAHCDVKIPWELSRLQTLLWTAEGYLLTPGNEKDFIDCFARIVEDWIDANPPGMGVNWTCAMEVAIRGINIMLSSAVLFESLPEPLRLKIIQSLADHYEFLRRFPETSDIAGNHYLTDLLGEVCLSSILAPDQFASHLDAFATEAERQFEPGGCHLERAPVYHRLCTDMVAIAAAFAVRGTHQRSERLGVVLSRAIEFASFLAGATGLLPVFGDCDSGQVLEFGSSARNINSLLQLSEFPTDAALEDQTIWLQAIAGSASIAALPEAEIGSVRDHLGERSGFLVAQSGNVKLTMRVGEQGLGGRASHDHDDAQSIWVTVGGMDVIVDEGCHSYTLSAAIRAKNISSRAHNVLQTISAPRFVGSLGSINLTMRGAPTCQSSTAYRENGKPTLKARIAKAGTVTDIERRADIEAGTSAIDISIVDTWSSDNAVEARWHFGPGIIPEITQDGLILFSGGTPLLRAEMSSDCLISIEPFKFDFSPVYGQAIACFGVKAVLAPSITGKLLTKFVLTPA